ncbi:MAG: hypothetical protein K8W52_34980, partial [Deltaproteobacteria bacterium]|nr:hypothetical protein [Deltaproteobacteria bacterium]
AVADADALARAMTIKCALAGLAAGGGKAVVLDHPGLDRARAFAILGARIAELGGLFRTAGDLGTTAADLAAMASRCPYVHTDERDLADAVARGVVGCAAACAARRGARLADLRVAIQGAGAIGAAVARALAATGATLLIADLDAARAAAVATATGATAVAPQAILAADVDLLAPCAAGGVLDLATVDEVRAWAVCGAANNVFASDAAARRLYDRGVAVVPDVVASAGAVIDGIGASVMGLDGAARGALIDRLAVTAAAILDEAAATNRTTTEVAIARARARLAA